MADTRSGKRSVADSNEELAGASQDPGVRHRLQVSTTFAFVRLGVLTI
jgi:hypothetical protein